jgi:hypothetical protein
MSISFLKRIKNVIEKSRLYVKVNRIPNPKISKEKKGHFVLLVRVKFSKKTMIENFSKATDSSKNSARYRRMLLLP